ncbi:MAG: multidrug transporter AcrB [Planctomycetota bacterium]|nr:MAG: multidrug transporter AcrB [Planctomycetota bacterium]
MRETGTEEARCCRGRDAPGRRTNLMRTLITFGVRNPVSANVLMLCLIAGGFYAARHIVRERYPEFSIDRIAVEVVYPGAGPGDVETGVCTPIETAIEGIDGIRELSSVASEGHGIVVAFLNEDADTMRVLDEIRVAVDQVDSLPAEAEEPVVREMVLRTGVVNLALSGDVPESVLRDVARDVERELRSLPGISQTAIWGVRDREILIEVKEDTLRAYALSFDEVMRAVASNSLDLPAGVLRTAREELVLRVTGRRMTASEYEDLVVLSRPDGTAVRLGQLATVRETFEDAAIESRFDGARCAVIAVYKTPEQDTILISNAVREYAAAKQGELPPALKLSAWADGSTEINGRVRMLLWNGLQGVALMVGALAFFMRPRVALWVMTGLPVAYAGALLVMYFTGHTINILSLFALIMVSGMIDDDAIVISESIYARSRRGEDADTATIEGVMDVAMPVVASSFTTIIAFIPLFFIVGVMGKFVREAPLVIIAALVASLVEVLLILPPHLRHHGGLAAGGAGSPARSRFRRALDGAMERVIDRVYAPTYRFALAHRYAFLSGATALVLVGVGLVAGGRLPLVLLSSDDNTILRARVELPEGTPADVSRRIVSELEAGAWALNADPDLKPRRDGALVRHVYATLGAWNDFLPRRGNNLCEVKIELMPPGQRWIRDRDIVDRWRRAVGDIPEATSFVVEPDGIAPTDRPIEIRLLGPDLDDLREASERLQERLAEFSGVRSVYDDMIAGKRELQVSLRPEARMLGLTVADVATQLRQGYFGGEALRLQRDREEVQVRVRYPLDERQSLSALENIRFRTTAGTEVPFHEAVDVTWVRGPAAIRHENGMRKVEVYADLDERLANAEQILSHLTPAFLPELVAAHPGMRFRVAGQRQLVDESLRSLAVGAAIAMVGMYVMLAVTLGSYYQPLIIMSAIPIGLVGSLLGHVVMGFDLSLMSLFGMLGLAGIVVNNVLVLIDFINARLRQGATVIDAVVESGKARFTAVALTSITTVVGLIPVSLDTSGEVYSVIPMAISLGFGLTFSTVVTLVLVPAIYLAFNDVRRALRWIFRGGAYPSPEEVEHFAARRGDVDAVAAGGMT